MGFAIAGLSTSGTAVTLEGKKGCETAVAEMLVLAASIGNREMER